MRLKFNFVAGLFVLAALINLSSASRVVAQEGEMTVIDEVIAQVNDDVITLSYLKRELKERVSALLQERKMTEQQATDEVMKFQAQLIATLINDRLLMQKGKELDLATEIESEVNRRMLEIARDQGIPSIEKLEAAMRESKLDPAAIKETMRVEMMKQAVIQQEVDRRVYLGFTQKEIKDYFEANKQKFLKPESIGLSEIFLTTNDKDDAAVKARALELVAQIRAGADFAAVAAANSEREKNGQRTAPQDKGKVGTFDVPNLREELTTALKDVKVGGISEPLKTPDGYQIIRVDERTPQGTTPTFNENQVRQAMLAERQPKERENYLQKLRNEAFIKISDTYSASVLPLLKLNAPAAAKGSEKDKKDKKP